MNQEEKEYRTRLYNENKEEYHKARKEFVYSVSQNFRQKRNDQKHEMKQLEDETVEAYQEERQNGLF